MGKNSTKCPECEFLRRITKKHTMFIKTICAKYDVELETDKYNQDAYKCFQCRNGG